MKNEYLRQVKEKFGRSVKVAVGLSGGVDSSVAAKILVDLGFDVVGVHMQCWDYNLPGCKGNEDRRDAIKIASTLGISFKDLNFVSEYKDTVLKYFFDEVKAGKTPNPDIMCNKEIKFGLFLKWALKEGFDFVATGHYARVSQVEGKATAKVGGDLLQEYDLLSGVDDGKDQSYFLFRLGQEALSHSLFPLGDYEKSETRELAKRFNLATAQKPDSVGICFIGDINVADFIRANVEVEKGPVVNVEGEVIGEHEGVPLYTIGQRHGFRLDKYVGMPVYVVKKDAKTNTLVVGFAKDSEVKEFEVGELSFIRSEYARLFGEAGEAKGVGEEGLKCFVRIRNLGEKMACRVCSKKSLDGAGKQASVHGQDSKRIRTEVLKVELDEYTVGVAPGQSAVFYDLVDKGKVLGGGVIY